MRDNYLLNNSQLPPEQQALALRMNDVLRRISDRLDGLDVIDNLVMYSKRITELGDPVQLTDALNVRTADRRYLREIPREDKVVAVRVGAFSQRGSPTVYANTIFEASDRNYAAWASDGKIWTYAYGIHSRTQSQLSTLAATLGTNDAGYLVSVTDFSHLLRWTGSGWEFGPGESGSGFIQGFVVAPPGGIWQLCNGTPTSYLKADGTTANFTTPNLTGHYAKFNNAGYTGAAAKGGTTANTTATNNAAATGITVVATATGITVDAHPDHIHDEAASLSTPDLFAPDITGSGEAGRTGIQKAVGGGALTLSHAVNDPGHLHAVSDPTHNHTQNAHNHEPGSLELDRTELLPYFRR